MVNYLVWSGGVLFRCLLAKIFEWKCKSNREGQACARTKIIGDPCHLKAGRPNFIKIDSCLVIILIEVK